MNWISERLPRCPRWTALALVLLVACGCGKRMSKVEGTVLLDDKPLDGATVVFQPEEGGQPATGMTGSDGVFHLTTRTTGDGARTGNYKVTITKRKESDGGAAPANAGGADSMKEAWKKYLAKPPAAKESSSIPSEYSNVEKTPLKCQVPVDGPLEFKLRSKGGS
jgi:hypothetical protein